MLTVSLHGIRIHANIGLYPEEKIHGNDFVIDTDVFLPDTQPWYFADYTLMTQIVEDVFAGDEELMESCVQKIYTRLKEQFPVAEKIRVCVRKLNPPMPGLVDYSQVCYEA